MFGSKDNRRSDKFSKSKAHFATGKYKPRSKSEIEPRCPKEGSSGRRANREIAEDTIHILETGTYEIDGKTIDISHSLANAIRGTVTYKPTDSVPDIIKEKTDYTTVFKSQSDWPLCRVKVINACTLDAILLHTNEKLEKVCALNFASSKNPGGGFLNGSNAQEESLARASGLYECIKDSEMYQANNEDNNHCLYQEYMIYSPDVPVFRDSKEELLESPINVSIISATAVNTQEVLKKNVPLQIINEIMHDRTDRLLSILVHHGIETVVLGAWGCGVFGGEINNVAGDFYTLLTGKYKNSFKEVIFAVIDPEHFNVFNSYFAT